MLISGVLFVVDCADRERLPESREELNRILESRDMGNVPLVVIANKQDLPGSSTSGLNIAGLIQLRLYQFRATYFSEEFRFNRSVKIIHQRHGYDCES